MKRLLFLLLVALLSCSQQDQTQIETVILGNGQQYEEFEYYLTNNTKVKNGYYKKWHSNDTLAQQGTFVDNHKTGNWVLYYPTGLEYENAIYDTDTIVGGYVSYYDNGQMMKTGNFEKGKRVGIWKYYWPNGQMKSEWHFESPDEYSKVLRWNEDGTVK